MAAPYLGKTRSGRPTTFAACSRYRNPRACRARRRASSGFVSLPLIPAIIRERVALSTMSAICPLASFPEPGIHQSEPIVQEPDLPSTFGVVDLFAGPGGLGDGF